MKNIIVALIIGISLIISAFFLGLGQMDRYKIILSDSFGALKYDTITGRIWRVGKTQIKEIKDYGLAFPKPEA